MRLAFARKFPHCGGVRRHNLAISHMANNKSSPTRGPQVRRIPKPREGRNSIGRGEASRWRAQPLQSVKNIGARGTCGDRFPRWALARSTVVSGLSPFGSSVAHSACRVGAHLIFCSQQGLRSRCSLSPCLSYFAPIRGLENSARFRSQVPTLWRHLPPQSRCSPCRRTIS